MQAVQSVTGPLQASRRRRSLVGPALNPNLPPEPQNNPLNALAFQAGRATRALMSGAGPAGLAQVAQQGQAEWQNP